MKELLQPISLDEKSFQVKLLHQVLKALGFPVSKSEAADGRAGQETLSQVRALQAQLNVQVDESALIDNSTSLAIIDALNNRGLIVVSRSFTVTGRVTLGNGQLKKRQRLCAFDLDLKGVAVLRTLKTVSDIMKTSGLEFLGETISDNKGQYRITFYDWQYKKAERKKADVVVFAVEGDNLIGLSRIVNSDDYSGEGFVRDLEIIITQKEERTEHEILMSGLTAFLSESDASLDEIAKSREQIEFTAGELDVDLSQINIAVSAELIAKRERKLTHELLYGIGRQEINLNWLSLHKKREEELRGALEKSVNERIISKYPEKEIDVFLKNIQISSAKYILEDDESNGNNILNTMLSIPLPEQKQRISFVKALGSFKGIKFSKFWEEHLPAQPEFENKKELISALQLTQQLTFLTGNNLKLISELQINRKITSIQQLFEFEESDWLQIIEKVGLPECFDDIDDGPPIYEYVQKIQNVLNATYPSFRIAKMVKDDELSIEKNKVSSSISNFLSSTETFDFASSRIHDFKKEIEAAAGEDFDEVKSELMKIQRVFQVSTNPEVMSALMENKLNSAYSIANMPRKSFVKAYGDTLGGEREALAVHERASHISKNSEMTAAHLMEYSHGLLPDSIMNKSEYEKTMKIIQNHLPNPTPNYEQLFGSPDICECKHCRSVYSASAYFVELLRFLENSLMNDNELTPFDILVGKRDENGNFITVPKRDAEGNSILDANGQPEMIPVAGRRPDLIKLALTCENTNTIIPYIDLANEVMEFYTSSGSLDNYNGHDTGKATAEELRANPQNFDYNAYLKLKDAKFPFRLPYHQPIDVIRVYGDHFKVSRYEVMKAMHPEPDAITEKAYEAESLKLSPEEYKIITREDFGGATDVTPTHEYFGYPDTGTFEGMQDETDSHGEPRGIIPLLERTGLAYTDLVELVKTLFINPYQGTLDYIESIFSNSLIDTSTLYTKLRQIEDGTLDPADDGDIVMALSDFNNDNNASITTLRFADWVTTNLGNFRQVITLYEPDSKCNLETTKLRSIQSIYESLTDSGIVEPVWSKIHRFIRLWRKLGWTIHETDLMLVALGENDLTTSTISKFESVTLLRKATRLPLNQLAVMWGMIDTYGDKSLYKKLFLNKAVQRIDQAFEADAEGNYLTDNGETLGDHDSAILAAFRISQEDLDAILEVAQVIDFDASDPNNIQNFRRLLNFNNDKLYLENLSTIYRHVLLAKMLKLRVKDLCRLIGLFNASPFSIWDIEEKRFTAISPSDTYDFFKLAHSIKKARFKTSELEYIINGSLPEDSRIGLGKGKILQTAKTIREELEAIEREHPETPNSPLTIEAVTAKLSLTFQSEIVRQLIEIVSGTASFNTRTDANLGITMPEDIIGKYTYNNGSGLLDCQGIMSDDEQDTLKNLPNATINFRTAIDQLYAAPEAFLNYNFGGVFGDTTELYKMLLDHPAQTPATELEDKLNYIYEKFLPFLKDKLRQDAVTKHIAELIGLSEVSTSLIIANNIDLLVSDLSTEGYSAAYYNDSHWNALALKRIDGKIDFGWGVNAPATQVSADNFSVEWETYIAAPASGIYTLIVEVEEADEEFELFLDGNLILRKLSGDQNTVLEYEISLNAAKMHLLTLKYAETSQNAGIRLRWKTATTAPEIIPSSVAYPAANLNSFSDSATLWHRAAKFISGFGLSETELNHLNSYDFDFGGIDFENLMPDHWKRVNDYITLRNIVPQSQALLTDLFVLANLDDPAPTTDQLIQLLHQATAWQKSVLQELIPTHFNLSVDDFKNEIALNQLLRVINIVTKTGISIDSIVRWGTAETNFQLLHETAQIIKNSVKAKYEEQNWLDIAGDLSDKLRENQRQALVDYLLTRQEIKDWGARDADGLYEYFLLDVQMTACMDTSRIVQANAAVQMFINRCHLNLESKMAGGLETGISPGAIDKERWEWMKNYRVWEANRKIFLFPENWLEPEWRNNRSEFFLELESYLTQNDITDRSVEEAFRNYLTNLNEVANLEVCGMYQENRDNGDLKFIHVFGRTHNLPYKYFYRRWNEFKKWSAWEKVQLDIRGVEDGDNSGVHLVPVVWKKRLFLFWPEFIEAQNPSSSASSGTKTIETTAEQLTPGQLRAEKYWEIRLAWSEYVDGRWSAKQLSKEFIKQSIYNVTPNPSVMRFITDIDSDDELHIYMHNYVHGYSLSEDSYYDWIELSGFQLSDITSIIDSQHFRSRYYPNKWHDYKLNFMNYSKKSKLQLLDDDYLKEIVDHKLLLTPIRKNYVPTLDDPFFYSGLARTYFVIPSNITVIERVKRHYDFDLPRIKELWECKINFPVLGPDDGPIIDPRFRRLSEMFAAPVGRNGGGLTSLSMTAERGHTASVLTASGKQGSGFYATESAGTKAAFVGTGYNGYLDWYYEEIARPAKGLEFHTFYHPFSSRFVTNLNQGGLSRGYKSKDFPPGLMESDTEIPSDDGATFDLIYDPDTDRGFVLKPPDFNQRTYYKENVCFDVYGANSLYNWELFFHAPLYIATRLSKNGKYEEAVKWFHYIFDPTTDEVPAVGESEMSRYWKVLPFKTEHPQRLEDWFRQLNRETNPESPDYITNSILSDNVSEWRNNPFDPHLVASNRQLAYMKSVVIKYVENLIDWGDSLFRRFSRESVYEALQLYVIANKVLGPRPEFVPKRGEIKTESFDSLHEKLDDFSNALVQLENIFPFSSAVTVGENSSGPNILGLGQAFYFCIPSNERLLDNWNTAADRLYKIRHCRDIDGVERKLALFAPPISPELLIQARSLGLSLGSILADLSSPPPIYRFAFLIQKANEFCGDVKALGSALLSALEKKDAEELSRLRASHETNILEFMTSIKERNILDAKSNRQNLLKVRETAKFRLQHYIDLLGNESEPVPPEPTIAATLTADSQLPVDTRMSRIKTDVDESLVDSKESGVKLISREKEDIEKAKKSMVAQQFATALEGIGGIVSGFPNISTQIQLFGVGGTVTIGGSNFGAATSAMAKIPQIFAQVYAFEGAQASKMGGFIRREQDWTLQANLAIKEIVQLDKQITSADIRIQVTEKELQNHEKQIANSEEIELFLKDKFTNQELYQWMKEQIFSVYKQSYNLAYDMAKRAEKACMYDLGKEGSSFIKYGYWDNSKQGLASGEKLQLALRQLDKFYLEENRRELELTKSVSIAMLNPLALIELKETGKCFVSLPEELFDLDFQGHYFRRIKYVSMSIPCIVGPYTNVNCTLRLLKNVTRINTKLTDQDEYQHKNEDGLWTDDDRFRIKIVPVSAIATSAGSMDDGMFEFNFKEERYLPFEGGGVISDWKIELTAEKNLRQLDYSTISDVIVHINYTAREDVGTFKDKVVEYINEIFLKNFDNWSEQPLMRMFSMKNEFPTEWHKFLHPGVAGAEQKIDFTIGKERMPFFTQHRDIDIMKLDVFAKINQDVLPDQDQDSEYDLILSFTDKNGVVTTSSPIPILMPQDEAYGNLNNVSLIGLTVQDIIDEKRISLNLKRHVSDVLSVATIPNEVEDIFLVIHYKLKDQA